MKESQYRKRKIEIIRKFKSSGLLPIFMSKDFRRGKIDNEKAFGEKLKEVLEELGPVFVKFGQFLSSRRDIFGEDVVDSLEDLQDFVSPIAFSEVNQVFKEEFGIEIKDVFYYVDEKPLASGSIAQTHLVKFRNKEGDHTACLKVQRQGIKEVCDLDTRIMKDLAKKYGDKFELNKSFNLVETVDFFSENLAKELDFDRERANMENFLKLNRHDKYVRSPGVYKDYSSKRVLTMDYIEGRPIKEALDSKEFDLSQAQKDSIAERLVYSYTNQIFRDGFFQADPHPGNIFIISPEEIYLLDFGIVGELTEENRIQIFKILMGVIYNQVELITDGVVGLGFLRGNSFAVVDFEAKIQEILNKYLIKNLHEIKISEVVLDFLNLLRQFKITIPAYLLNFGKTVILLEGLVERFSNEKSLVELMYPLGKKLMSGFLRGRKLAKIGLSTSFDFLRLSERLPYLSLNILRELEDGSLRLVAKKEDEEKRKEEAYRKKDLEMKLLISLSLVFGGFLIGQALTGGGFSLFNSLTRVFLIFIFVILFLGIFLIRKE